ncbi:hypothetical protein [Actinomycetospora sp. TBRC 11914]|uniref:hypothetical protein n=1 Tax=Actinomycetospora sp. TBRC 11914 TaxID=2729387 RepID=UPI00145F8162|nr:hypothetical protein [Actinomycetospora sp. TBRC 11914]NMO88532.1 hypothetical protein [Actinomycetospora sp. TBRC 11914]
MTDLAARPRAATTPALRAVQALAVLTVLELAWQFATAGEMVGRSHSRGAHELHSAGAIVLHVLTGLLTIAAVAYWRGRGAPLWPAVLAAVVFVLTFVQAYLGDDETLYLHVPGALVLTVGSVWVLAWSFTPGARVVTGSRHHT